MERCKHMISKDLCYRLATDASRLRTGTTRALELATESLGGVVFVRKQYLMTFPLLVLVACLGLVASASATDRKVKSKVSPTYPELAKKMSVSGAVKVEITVAPNGSVKNVKVIGGHPLLVDAATDAVKRWKYETAPEETTEGPIVFNFSPNE